MLMLMRFFQPLIDNQTIFRLNSASHFFIDLGRCSLFHPLSFTLTLFTSRNKVSFINGGCCNFLGCGLDTCWTNEYVMLDASGDPQLPNNGEMVPCCESPPLSGGCDTKCSQTFGFNFASNRTLSGPSRSDEGNWAG